MTAYRAPRKPMRGLFKAALHILATGLALCVFALFHHVLPIYAGGPKLTIVKPSAAGTPAPAPAMTGAAAPEAAGASPNPSAPSPTPAPVGDFSRSFPGYDTGVGALYSYQGDDLKIAIDMVQHNDITYFYADVWIRDISCFKTAFAGGVYGRGIRSDPLDMAAENGAVFAVTGDYYGARDIGIVIRNGDLYRDKVFKDVCILYIDGTMEVVAAGDFSLEDAIARGAYQAWSFGPNLLEGGRARSNIRSEVSSKNPRTAIGYFAPGHYCFVVVDGRLPGYSDGMTLDELSSLMAALGCAEAYNLDGGQTAAMIFQGNYVNKPADGGRDLSDIVFFKEG